METSSTILILGLIALTALVIFFVIRNKKDKKVMMQKFIQEDEGFILADHDTEDNSSV